MDNFNLRKYLAENKLRKNSSLEEMHITNQERYNYDDPNSPISKLDKDQAAIEAMNSILTKYPIDVIRHWIGCFKK